VRLVLRMKDDQHRFLSLVGQLPVRLTAEQAGWLLNCQSHDIPALIHSRLLKPLGNPSAMGVAGFGLGHFVHWRLPSPVRNFRVGGRQVRPGDLQVQDGLAVGFVLGMQERERGLRPRPWCAGCAACALPCPRCKKRPLA